MPVRLLNDRQRDYVRHFVVRDDNLPLTTTQLPPTVGEEADLSPQQPWANSSTKGHVAAGFRSNQAAARQTFIISLTDLSLQTVGLHWLNCVLLTGWNKNLQSHSPLWKSLPMPGPDR